MKKDVYKMQSGEYVVVAIVRRCDGNGTGRINNGARMSFYRGLFVVSCEDAWVRIWFTDCCLIGSVQKNGTDASVQNQHGRLNCSHRRSKDLRLQVRLHVRRLTVARYDSVFLSWSFHSIILIMTLFVLLRLMDSKLGHNDLRLSFSVIFIVVNYAE